MSFQALRGRPPNWIGFSQGVDGRPSGNQKGTCLALKSLASLVVSGHIIESSATFGSILGVAALASTQCLTSTSPLTSGRTHSLFLARRFDFRVLGQPSCIVPALITLG